MVERCSICFEEETDCRFLPCRHAVCCLDCYYRMHFGELRKRKRLRCPLCRTSVEEVELADPGRMTMRVFVEKLSGATETLQTCAHERVAVFAKRLSLKLGIPPDVLRLSYGSRILERDRWLAVYNIQNGATLSLHLIFRRGF